MLSYFLKRILLAIPTLIGITLITFFIMRLAPGDPNNLRLRHAPPGIDRVALAQLLKAQTPVVELSQTSKDFIKSLSSVFHSEFSNSQTLEAPFAYKTLEWVGISTKLYFKWLAKIVRFDFGYSSQDRHPAVSKLILQALPITLLINILSLIIIYSVSIPLGIWSAVRTGSVLDKIVMVKLFIFYSFPTFWLATILLMLFAGSEYFNWFPLMGLYSDTYDTLGFFGKIFDGAWHLFLPIVATTLGSFAFMARFTRGNFLDVIKQDYIRTARAKGLSEKQVLFKHGLRNAMIPFVTLMGALLPEMLGGSVIIEQIFSIPGMGMLSFESVLTRDHNVIMAIATLAAVLTLLGILLSDWLYTIVDPRVKFK